MNTYRIKFYELIGRSCEVEIDACSEEEAKELFWDELDVHTSLSDCITKDVLSTDIDKVELIYEDLEEEE
jgi:hypothetical protein